MSIHSRKKVLRERVQIHPDGRRERWRDVIRYVGLYRVSDWGRVKSLPRRTCNRNGYYITKTRILRPRPNTDGYLTVAFYRNKKRQDFAVHLLVLEAFIGFCPSRMEACHNDGDPSNACLSNLRWDTHAANMQDRILHGRGCQETNPKGKEIWWSKITEQDVKEIRRLYASGQYTQSELAVTYGVGQTLISRVVLRRIWRHVP